MVYLCLPAQKEWINIIAPEQINEITEIEGRYYCATYGGIVIYDPVTEAIERINVSDGLPSQKISDITTDASGNIWVATYDKGIAVWEGEEWRLIPAPETDFNITFIYSLEFDDQGFLWTGTERGTFKYVNEEWQATEVLKAWDMQRTDEGVLLMAGPWPVKVENGAITQYPVPVTVLTYAPVSTIEYGSDGTLYWGNNRGGFEIIENTDYDSWIHYSPEYFGLTSDITVTDIEILDNGEVWIVFENGWIFTLIEDDWVKMHELETHTFPQLDLTTNGELLVSTGEQLFEITEVIEDYADLGIEFANNDIDLITNEYGEVFVMSNNQVIKYSGVDLSTTEETPPNGEADFSGLIFVKFPDDSFGYFERSTGSMYSENEFIALYNPLDYFTQDEIDSYYDYKILVDENNAFWITSLKGLFYYDNGTLTVFNEDNSSFIPVTPNTENYLFFGLGEDQNGNIWVNTNKGLATWYRDSNNWEMMNHEDNNFVALSASHFYFDEDNELWAAGFNGLLNYDGETWSVFNTENSDLSGNRINQIVPWQDQLILVGPGITFFAGENFTNLSQSNAGLGSNYSEKMVIDAQGNFWIDHFKFGEVSYGGISIYKQDGIALGSLNLPSIFNEIPFSVYPNPTNDYITIDHNIFKDEIDAIYLTNTDGSRVLSHKVPFTGNSTRLSVKSLKTGVYILTVLCGNIPYTTKVLIK